MNVRIPRGWEMPLLGEVVQIKQGNSKLTKKLFKSDGKYVAFSGSGPDGLTDSYEHEGRAIILSAVGARCGKCFKAEGKWTAIANTAIIQPLFDNDAFYEYLFYLLNNENFWPKGGTAQPFVQSGIAQRETRILLPPLNEQRRIVAKLEELLSKVEESQNRLVKIPAILKRFRQSVLAAACSGRLTADWRENISLDNDLPATWRQTKLENLCELITKGASPKWQGVNYSDKGVLFITSENVRAGNLLLDTKKYVESKINEIQPRSILRKGDLLTNIVGASIGRSAIFDLDDVANINQAVALIRLKKEIERKYILYVLNSPALLERMDSEKVDVARANLSLKDVSNFPIPLPPVAEQQEIVCRVEKLFALADQIEARYTKAQAQVDKLTQSILAKTFRGELVPQNPRDEPANVLLERIKLSKGMKNR